MLEYVRLKNHKQVGLQRTAAFSTFLDNEDFCCSNGMKTFVQS